MARKYASDDAQLNVGSIVTSRTRDYRDINLLFTANPNTGDIYKVNDAAAVKQSVRTIIRTNNHEKPFNPSFGGGLRELLFENFNPFTVETYKNKLRTAITNDEPRVSVVSINISQDTFDLNSINISVVFRVKETSETEQIEVVLERLR